MRFGIFLLLLAGAAHAQGSEVESTGTGTGVAARAVLDARDDIAFRAMALPDTVWVGQQATYQVGVFLSDEIRQRLRRNPVFVPPELRSMLAFDLASTLSPPRYVGQRRYEIHVFQRALFPLTAGVHAIPPARLEYALPLSNSFFAREESHSARTEGLIVIAREPPATGRPVDYRGAVGRLSLQTQRMQGSLRTGDPFTLTAVVQGVGNVSLLPRPDFSVGWADVVPGAVRVQLDSTTTLVRGRKEFDWIVTPLRPGRHRIPEARYPFFNPYTEQYEVAVSRPEEVTVTGTPVAIDRDLAPATPALPIRRRWQGEAPLPISDRGGFWLVMALAPLPLAGAWLAGRPRRAAPGLTHERQLLAAAAAQAADVPLVRRLYASGIAYRVLLSPGEMSDRRRLFRALARAGVTDETARQAADLLGTLDDAVFGRQKAAAGSAERAAEILRAIDGEARTRSAIAARRAFLHARSAMLVLALLLTSAAAPWPSGALISAVQRSGDVVAQRVFTDGLQAYDAREFGLARQSFHELAQARPRSADAWFNFAAASWQLQDTAAAVIGWHRALRLQPTAEDVRDLLRLAPGTPMAWHGVPPISLNTTAMIGAAAWITGFILLTSWIRRRRRVLARGGLTLVSTAVVALLAGLLQHEVLLGRQASVVLGPTRLRELPVLSGDAGVEAQPGELVRVIGEQGAWSRVRLSDGRTGWLEARQIESVFVEGARGSELRR